MHTVTQIVILSLDFRMEKNSIQFPALLLPAVGPWASHLPQLSHLWNGSRNGSRNLQACWRTNRAKARRVRGTASAVSRPGNSPPDIPVPTAQGRAHERGYKIPHPQAKIASVT